MTDLTNYCKGSVQSLKPGVLSDLKKMFDQNSDQGNEQSSSHKPRPAVRILPPSKPPPRQKKYPAIPSRPDVSPSRLHHSPNRTPQKKALSPIPFRKKFVTPPRPFSEIAPKPNPKPQFLENLGAVNNHNGSPIQSVGDRKSRLVERLESSGNKPKSSGAVGSREDQNTGDNNLAKLLNKDGIPDVLIGSTAISVNQRTKMFESTSTDISGSPPRPVKPPPPDRSRERTKSADYTEIDSQNQTDDNTATVEHSRGSAPPPPRKPPRNFRHDDYMRVKVGKSSEETINEEKESELTDSYEQVDIPLYKKINRSLSVSSDNENSLKKNRKPMRPPPPKKIRPFSIATDTLSCSGSDSDDIKTPRSRHNSYYETVSLESNSDSSDQIKHWDLPRSTHPEPIRRSLSDDCIQRNTDNEGNVVYIDPKNICTEDAEYDVYVDQAGYAVPHKLVKRKDSSGESETSRPVKDRVKSKFRRFKNFFNEPEKKSPSSGDRPRPVNRVTMNRKIEQVKQKVDEAFSPIAETEVESEEDEVRVDTQELQKRVEYSRSVRMKTNASIRESLKKNEKIYPQLFEHAMIVGLRKGAETGEFEPYVKYKFPEIRNYKLTMDGELCLCTDMGDSNVSVPQFCFPDAANFKLSSHSATRSQSYSFVLTNIDGGRVYGYCRRFVPPDSPNKTPEVICIISPVDAFMLYNSLLEQLEKRRMISNDVAQEMIAASFGRPLPAAGEVAIVKTLDIDGEMETVFLNREIDSRVENVNCECLLAALSPEKLLKVFSSIMLERSVLFCAKHLSILSSTIHALASLLYPFSWQHTYIPVLPSSMLDVVCSPTPYIIGITSQNLQQALTLPLDENVMVVDLDTKKLVRIQGDEGKFLPLKVEKALKKLLNICKFDPESSNLMISEGFLRFFIMATGHYGQYIKTKPDGQKYFDKEDFIKGSPVPNLDELLTWFVETQMFEVFMTSHLDKKDTKENVEYFQMRIADYKSLSERLKRQAAGNKQD